MKSPWYVYMHPMVNEHYFFDWWDAQFAGTDWNALLFAVPEANRYRAGSTGLKIGPRIGQRTRRPQFACPTIATYKAGDPVRYVFEAHGSQKFTGQQKRTHRLA